MRFRFLVLAVLLVACGGRDQGSPEVVLTEFEVDAHGTWTSDEMVVPVRNDGEFAHTLVITDEWGEVVAATDLIEPGEEIAIGLTLDPGTYQLTCRIVVEVDDGLVDHFERGMSTIVSVES